jgi:hypothetical protein
MIRINNNTGESTPSIRQERHNTRDRIGLSPNARKFQEIMTSIILEKQNKPYSPEDANKLEQILKYTDDTTKLEQIGTVPDELLELMAESKQFIEDALNGKTTASAHSILLISSRFN